MIQESLEPNVSNLCLAFSDQKEGTLHMSRNTGVETCYSSYG